VSPFPQPDDTIAAVSTPTGRSGIGVIRLSGPSSQQILEQFFVSADRFEDRRARYGVFKDSASGRPVDQVVVTFFKGPHSYTGEDMVEISGHGNPSILNRMLGLLVDGGARRAEPGEFTLRGVAHGKMDLAQAEAVRDFIDAQTDAQARTAMLQMDGALAKRVRPEKNRLVGVVAELEAGIDFAEDDVPIPDGGALSRQVLEIAEGLERLGNTFAYGRLLGEGLNLAIAGKTNVGKSSLFNQLTSAGRAIVTDVPGTTRDVINETVAIAGVPIRFSDTAGVRETGDEVEIIGVDRTFETLAEADLTLVVLDGSRPLDSDDSTVLDRVSGRPNIVVVNKKDLDGEWDTSRFPEAVHVSALTGAGTDVLRTAIENYLSMDRPAGVDDYVITSARQKDALTGAVVKLGEASQGLESGVPHEMILLDLYSALSSIGELTGEVTTDDILDRVFSTFCIGK
jgi:tRNA modification GTPase